MSSAYVVEQLDLTAARTVAGITSTLGGRVAAVYVLSLPAAVFLHFGANGNGIPLEQGKSYEPCPAETDGIFLTNVAAAGTLRLLISYDQGEVSVQQ